MEQIPQCIILRSFENLKIPNSKQIEELMVALFLLLAGCNNGTTDYDGPPCSKESLCRVCVRRSHKASSY
jgi:hypothetical protein